MQPDVRHVLHEPTSTFSYVVWDPDSLRAAVIDPVLDYDAPSGYTGTETARSLIDIIRREGLIVDWVLETHAHADHLSAAPFVRAQLGNPPLGIGEGIRIVQARFKELFGLEPELRTDGGQYDRLFADGETFRIGGIEARVLHTPGHTSDHVTYVIGDAAFVGDTLFMPDAGTARCDFPGGDPAALYRSAHRLFTELADETRMFMLHDYAPGRRQRMNQTTVGEQRRTNIQVGEGISEQAYAQMRMERDRSLGLPTLIIPSVQVNIRGGELPPAESNGVRYLKVPVNAFPRAY